MTYLCCPGCRLRFSAAAAVYLTSCPECNMPAAPVSGPTMLVGFRLFDPLDAPHDMPEAVAVQLPVPTLDGPRP